MPTFLYNEHCLRSTLCLFQFAKYTDTVQLQLHIKPNFIVQEEAGTQFVPFDFQKKAKFSSLAS